MFKGWIGEQRTELNLWFSLDKELYRRFHDVIIPSSNGTTQIDHILISPFGLFIVETNEENHFFPVWVNMELLFNQFDIFL